MPFGATATGTTSDLTLIVRNTAVNGATTAAPSAPFITFSGAGAARYTSPSTTCTAGLAGNDGTSGSGADECRFTIRYAPTSVGSNVATATINFGTLTDTVALTGNGVLNAVLGMDVTTAQTCTTTPNAALTTTTCTGGTWVDYTINNGGDVAMSSALTIAFSGAQFRQLAAGGGRCISGTTVLAAGGSCVIRVEHQPDDLTADTTTITVSGNIPGGTVSTVVSPTITGNARSALTVAGAGAFAATAVGAVSATTTYTYTYVAGASASSGVLRTSFAATGNPADFDVVSDTCTGAVLAAGGTCAVGVRFRPSMTGARTADLTVDDPRDFVRATIALSGTGNP